VVGIGGPGLRLGRPEVGVWEMVLGFSCGGVPRLGSRVEPTQDFLRREVLKVEAARLKEFQPIRIRF
jgi:hypothetical protein